MAEESYFILFMVIAFLVSISMFIFLKKKLIKLENHDFGVFSMNDNDKQDKSPYYDYLIKQYSRQQKLSFYLLFFSILISIIIGVFIILKVAIFYERINLKFVSHAVTLAGQISLSVGSFKLYQKSSHKLESLLKNLTTKKMR